ncbi:MAG TPA: STAS domain-containing protein [Acidimicrobiales bacterium]|jgi:anti-sigma B factor antagonist|nr:STAS domain-containing protein [Acidimicrobiales bacterium]
MTDFSGLEVTSDDAGSVAVAGDIDFATAPQLRQALVDVLEARGPDAVVDLSAVAFIDASGIGVLVGAAQLADSKGGRLIIRNPSRAVSLLLDVLDLDEALAVQR